MSNQRLREQARGSNAPGRPPPRPVPGFDGPASRGSNSAAGSQSRASAPPAQARSRTGSNASLSQVSGPPQPLLRDPARDGPAPRKTDVIKNVDMPASFYNIDRMFALDTAFAARPGFNTTGKPIMLPVNSYQIMAMPVKTIYQYDVIIGNGAEKKLLQEKIWASKARKARIAPEVIYDGNKLAWSLNNLGEIRMMVDLAAEQGRQDKDGKNTFRVHMRPTKTLNLAVLQSYLKGQMQFSDDVLEAINFLDHLLREGPSRDPNLVQVKRSFFARNGQKADLGSAVEVFRGVYQSVRPAQGGKLVLNLDVANACFWKPQSLMSAILQRNNFRQPGDLLGKFKSPEQVKATSRYLKKMSVRAEFRGNPSPQTVWTIHGLSSMTANSHRLNWRDQNGQETGEKVSVAAYFKRKYNVNLQYPDLPLVETTRKIKGVPIMYPMEFLNIPPNQRYTTKLDEVQTANMIKFAVSPPSTRAQAIEEGKSWLKWHEDVFLNNYGLKISDKRIETQARILPSPNIQFGPGAKGVERPGNKGRWDLRGKLFHSSNDAELSSWGVGIFTRGRTRLDTAQIEKFCLDFAKQYRGHGGKIASTRPHIMQLPDDPGNAAYELHQATGNAFQKRPQLLVFIVQDRNSQHYLRIKKSADCRFGVVSQVMQAQQVAKGNPQYISNVLMKVNAKLGGCTSKVIPAPASGFKQFAAPTCIIGADVSHASPGAELASIAALTLSMDKHAGRYAAACNTNGFRTEMIQEKTWSSRFEPLMRYWTSNVGGGRAPAQVYYMRDGVSEGQFAQVMQQEVPRLRAVLNNVAGGKWTGQLTVIVAGKRHHIRAFPKHGDGDAKGNPQPGTLIEKDVTSLSEFDFYLYSHIALQGTSRPVHYTVLHDEANHRPDQIQNMIYEHCYQYMRSTTSVSLHPAVYYAHLAADRALAHIDSAAAAGPMSGPGMKQGIGSSQSSSAETPDLLVMPEANRIQYAMWYI